ncbi:T9SS type A sorting domain-containing protein [Psychroflexus aestuariivivens]|uniref:T9SS type A sorting domain-containing protein n=1 Tax=Psychroflexus aestuariivivens TaxID=1795040 RepID=UPI000FD91823|nr:T9SS type A sorting domain-containing protein [Psychroflexus aestuariivivens]
MKYLYFLSLVLFTLNVKAQFSEVLIIDDSEETGAVTNISSADFNNDDLVDLLLSRAGNKDQINVYYNQGTGNFSRVVIENNLNDPVFVNYGDFDDNGFLDVVAISETGGEIVLYMNDVNGFSNPVVLGSEGSFGKSIVVDDFNADGFVDFVVIHQHAIAVYENNGNAEFTKNPILTTAESPNILECFDLVKMDVNGDGHMDVITAETLGLVVYTNDGNANFTPETMKTSSIHTISSLQKIDFNNDGLEDLVFLDANSELLLFENESATTSTFTLHSNIAQISSNSVKAIRSIDQNGDDLPDIYLGYNGQPHLLQNDSNYSFNQDLILDDQSALFVQEVHVADLNNDGLDEFIWESAGGTLAYQNNTILNLEESTKFNIEIYPNPTSDVLQINCQIQKQAKLSLYDLNGKGLSHFEIDLPGEIDLSELAKGTYILKIQTEHKIQHQKIIKH